MWWMLWWDIILDFLGGLYVIRSEKGSQMSRSEWCNLRKNLPSVALKVKKKEFIGKECGPPWESGKEKPWILPRAYRNKHNPATFILSQ